MNFLISFEDHPLNFSDYERAAEMFNICRKKAFRGAISISSYVQLLNTII